ncbi:MAG: PASTA domain-containing protein [Mycobacteriaceae bacterium]|nr:PASTA domain-containing protein [Mycobacteriaceae bacterium]
MSRLILIGAGAVGAAGIAMAFVGQGVAGADALSDVTGKYYGQAKQLLSKAGLTPIIATRVGDVASEDNCVIDRIQPANFTNGTGTATSKTVYVYLNCYANVASAVQPGYSRQSQLGAAAYNAQQQQQQQAAAQQQQQQDQLSQAQQQAAAAQQAQSEESVTANNPH